MTFHSRNRHQGRYAFDALVLAEPSLGKFIIKNPSGDSTIDFSNPRAVKALNGALLRAFYGIKGWDVPQGYLCPPVPGRSDYIHQIADLLAQWASRHGQLPRGPGVRVLDIGVGANAIYPLVGIGEYGWSFVGVDVDTVALSNVQKILRLNPELASTLELRVQKNPDRVFDGVLKEGERFDAVICNPPFHASRGEANAGSRRKWKNLGKNSGSTPILNFGGTESELVFPGGELAFIERMVRESVRAARQVGWFTTLVSKQANLPILLRLVRESGAKDAVILEMAQGQKKSRALAWTFDSMP